jgi:hypothetical protein
MLAKSISTVRPSRSQSFDLDASEAPPKERSNVIGTGQSSSVPAKRRGIKLANCTWKSKNGKHPEKAYNPISLNFLYSSLEAVFRLTPSQMQADKTTSR